MGMKLDPELERKVLEMAGLGEAPPEGCPAGDEEAFRQEVRRYAKREGWACYHTYSSKKSDPGFPDEVMLRNGVQVVAECKRSKKERPTEDQEHWLNEFRKVPGCVVRVWSPEDWPEIKNLLGGKS